MKKLGAAILIVSAGFIIIGSVLSTYSQSEVISTDMLPKQEQLVSETHLPSEIEIPKISFTRHIYQGGQKDGKWILSGDGVFFLPTSQNLGEKGNTVLYAHNTKYLFGVLKNLKVGDEIIIKDQKQQQFTFRIYSIEDIQFNEPEKLATDQEDTLTMYTCDGWFDQKRLVVKAQKAD